MGLDAIENRANLTDRIRTTIAKIDAKPWKRTDEERQQFEAEAIMRAHVGPELDVLVARVRELEEENQQLRDSIASQIFADEQKCQEAIDKDPTSEHLNGRLAGLQRARDIAKEET